MLAPFYGAMRLCIFWRTGIDHGLKYKRGQRLLRNFTKYTIEISLYVIPLTHALAQNVPLILSLPHSLAKSQADLITLRAYESRTDIESYTIVFQKVFNMFGAAIHESLTRTMGQFLEVTGGRFANKHKTEWEKNIAAHMVCTNNAAESPFATVRALLHIYPRYITLPFTTSAVFPLPQTYNAPLTMYPFNTHPA